MCLYTHFYTHIADTRIFIRAYAYTYTHICVWLYAPTRILMCTITRIIIRTYAYDIRTYAYNYARFMRVFWLTYIWAVLYADSTFTSIL